MAPLFPMRSGFAIEVDDKGRDYVDDGTFLFPEETRELQAKEENTFEPALDTQSLLVADSVGNVLADHSSSSTATFESDSLVEGQVNDPVEDTVSSAIEDIAASFMENTAASPVDISQDVPIQESSTVEDTDQRPVENTVASLMDMNQDEPNPESSPADSSRTTDSEPAPVRTRPVRSTRVQLKGKTYKENSSDDEFQNEEDGEDDDFEEEEQAPAPKRRKVAEFLAQTGRQHWQEHYKRCPSCLEKKIKCSVNHLGVTLVKGPRRGDRT